MTASHASEGASLSSYLRVVKVPVTNWAKKTFVVTYLTAKALRSKKLQAPMSARVTPGIQRKVLVTARNVEKEAFYGAPTIRKLDKLSPTLRPASDARRVVGDK